MFTTLLGDYVIEEHRGKASGLLGVSSGLGAIFSVVVLLKLPSLLKTTSDFRTAVLSFTTVSILALIGCLVVLVGLVDNVKQKHKNPISIIKEGIYHSRNPNILFAYLSSFLARGDSVLITTFVGLWVNQYMESMGYSKEESISKSGMVSGIAQTMALVAAPFVGIIMDYLDHILGLLFATIISFLGYFYMYKVNNPTKVILN
jgi:MFS family permease